MSLLATTRQVFGKDYKPKHGQYFSKFLGVCSDKFDKSPDSHVYCNWYNLDECENVLKLRIKEMQDNINAAEAPLVRETSKLAITKCDEALMYINRFKENGNDSNK